MDELAAEPVLVFGDWTDALAEQLPPLMPAPDALTQELRRAGRYKPSAKNEFLAIRNVLAPVAVMLTGVYAVMVGPERPDLTMKIVVWGLSAAVLLYIGPWFYLRRRRHAAAWAIQRALPDAFDMLTMCFDRRFGIAGRSGPREPRVAPDAPGFGRRIGDCPSSCRNGFARRSVPALCQTD